ncbi:MAG: hypothetical protein IAF58_01645, partial [Leptolyngbya sp.]|nr:hypothetical protein [Candidatus Melainabacteria bacterium]
MNPFEIHGPIYLPIYAVICGVAFLLTSKFKQQLLSDKENTSEAKITATAHNLNPYQAAYLSGGVERVFLAVCGVLA